MSMLMRVLALVVSLGLASGAQAQGGGSGASDQPASPSGGGRSSTAAAAGSKDGADAMMAMKVREIIGRDVVNASGKDIGEIDDVVLNEQDQTLYAVVGVGGFFGLGEKQVVIALEQLRLGADKVILMSERSGDDLKKAQAYRKGQWKSVEPDRTLNFP